LSLSQRRWLWQSAPALLAIKTALTILPYPTFRKLFGKLIESGRRQPASEQTLHEVAQAIEILSARWPWRAVCLPQALTYKYILRNDASLLLKIGVNRSSIGEFQAHAWVEKDGKLLIGKTAETYQQLWEWRV
jgi:Transglutaminase-like superfamily